MKKQPFLLAIIGVLTIGCHNSIEESIDDIIISNSNGDYTRSDVIDSTTAKEIIANIGYDTTQFEDKSEYYLVEKTYRFYKEDMIAIRNNHIQQSRSGSSETIPQHYRHINIELVSCVDPSIISPIIPTMSKPLPTLYNYNYGSSYDWRKEYYTGHIYCPSDGIRETESMSILELPMQQLITNVVNHNDLVILSNNSRKIRVGE